MPDAATVVRHYLYRLFDERDLDVCDELLSPDYVDHDAPSNTPPGPSATREYIAQLLADYPDLTITVDELICQGSTVALRATWHGTHQWTRTPLRQKGIVFIHVDDSGRLRERWSAYVTD